MSEMKHSPAWHIDQSDDVDQPRVLNWTGNVIAVLPEGSEHGRLIAAAPDLLAALKALSASIFAPDDDRSPELSAALRMTVSAIAKAEGRAESLPLSKGQEEGRG